MKILVNKEKHIIEMEATLKYNKEDLSCNSKSHSKINTKPLKSLYSISGNNCEFVTLLKTNADQKDYELQSIERQFFHKHQEKIYKHRSRIERIHSKSQERIDDKTKLIEDSKTEMIQGLEDSKAKLEKYNDEICKLAQIYHKQEDIIKMAKDGEFHNGFRFFYVPHNDLPGKFIQENYGYACKTLAKKKCKLQLGFNKSMPMLSKDLNPDTRKTKEFPKQLKKLMSLKTEILDDETLNSKDNLCLPKKASKKVMFHSTSKINTIGKIDIEKRLCSIIK